MPARDGEAARVEHVARDGVRICCLADRESAADDHDVPDGVHDSTVPDRAALQRNERKHHADHRSGEDDEQAASERKLRAQNVHNAKQERRHDDGDDLVPTLRKEVQDHAAKDHFLHETGGDACERDPGAEGAEDFIAAHIRAHKCAAKEQRVTASGGGPAVIAQRG